MREALGRKWKVRSNEKLRVSCLETSVDHRKRTFTRTNSLRLYLVRFEFYCVGPIYELRSADLIELLHQTHLGIVVRTLIKMETRQKSKSK